MVLKAYFDESGTHAQSHLVTLAGLMASAGRWKALSRAWRRILKTERISEFKSADCDAGHEEFEGWSIERRNNLRLALAAVIDREINYGVAISAVAADYRTEIGTRVGYLHELQDPYVWCLQSCLEFIFRDKWRLRKGRMVACTFDAGHKNWGNAQRYYLRIRSNKPGWSKAFAPVAVTGDSREIPALQAADLIVYEMRHWTDKFLASPPRRPRRPDLSRFFKRLAVDGGFFDSKALRGFADRITADFWRDYGSEVNTTFRTWWDVCAEQERI